MPYHLLLSSVDETLLFHDHVEASALWQRLRQRLPVVLAACLMPDHVHLLLLEDERRRLGDAACAFAQWRNARRGERGRVFDYLPPSEEVSGGQKVRRSVRYVHLNPCRAGLVGDPLTWTWSTHRDALGLVASSWRRRAPDVVGFHRYVSSDQTVRVDGTELPSRAVVAPSGERGFRQVQAAVSEVLRVPWRVVAAKGPARRLVLSASRELGSWTAPQLALLAGVTPRAVRLATEQRDPRVRLVANVLGDARMPGLVGGDLRSDPAWRRYARRRGLELG